MKRKEYLNYTVENGKVFGIPVKGQETFKGMMESINHEEEIKHLQNKINEMKKMEQWLSNMDSFKEKLGKLELRKKKLTNAINKL